MAMAAMKSVVCSLTKFHHQPRRKTNCSFDYIPRCSRKVMMLDATPRRCHDFLPALGLTPLRPPARACRRSERRRRGGAGRSSRASSQAAVMASENKRTGRSGLRIPPTPTTPSLASSPPLKNRRPRKRCHPRELIVGGRRGRAPAGCRSSPPAHLSPFHPSLKTTKNQSQDIFTFFNLYAILQ